MKKYPTFFTTIMLLYTSFLIAQPENSTYFNGVNSEIVYCNSCSQLWQDEDFGHEALTVSFWAKWSDFDNAGNWANMVSLNNTSGSGDNGTFWFQHDQTNEHFEFAAQAIRSSDSSLFRRHVRSTTSPVEDRWYYLTGIFDGSSIFIYVDGVEEGRVSISGDRLNYYSGQQTALTIGRWARDLNRNFNGSIGEVTIWRKVLTDPEILQQMYNRPNTNDPDLLFYATLEDPTNIQDLSTYSLNFKDTTAIFPSSNTILPVTLVSFTAENQNEVNKIEWTTASELNNNYFLLERSSNGFEWDVITTIYGAGTVSTEQNYLYEDRMMPSTINYYRLTQVDFDGQQETFHVVSVDNRTGKTLVKRFNLAGQEVNEFYKGMVIELFDDGTSIKRLNP